LLVGEEPQFLTLREMLRAGGRRHDVVGVEDRHGSPTFRDVHPGDLEIRVVHTIEDDAAGDETLGSDPRFDDEYAARAEMASHAAHGLPKSGERRRVAN
jgi:hypothetical protein